jgi:putative ATPase
LYLTMTDMIPLFDLPEEEDSPDSKSMPLAARMRPQTFDEFVGQEHLVAPGRVFRKCIEADQLPSMVFWGPPGSGKTTLARIIANVTKAKFSSLSAVSAGVADLRRVIGQARKRLRSSGTVTFIGATTENPSFEVIAPLLSRSRVFRLHLLGDEEIGVIAKRAIEDKERGLGKFRINMNQEALNHLVTASNGDARVALNALEMAVFATLPDSEGSRSIDLSAIEEALQHRALLYDKSGDQHYDLISALHKSLRGSDPDAGLYWLGRMLEAGEDPLYVARRLVRFASEDVGMADPQALMVAVASQQAVHFIGLPEGSLALAEAVVYLATAPKSNSLYQAYSRVRHDIEHGRNEPVPLHLCNPVTKLMRDTGYGRGYKYAHDYPDHFVKQQNLPASLQGRHYYVPGKQGYEKEIADRLRKWWQNTEKEV